MLQVPRVCHRSTARALRQGVRLASTRHPSIPGIHQEVTDGTTDGRHHYNVVLGQLKTLEDEEARYQGVAVAVTSVTDADSLLKLCPSGLVPVDASSPSTVLRITPPLSHVCPGDGCGHTTQLSWQVFRYALASRATNLHWRVCDAFDALTPQHPADASSSSSTSSSGFLDWHCSRCRMPTRLVLTTPTVLADDPCFIQLAAVLHAPDLSEAQDIDVVQMSAPPLDQPTAFQAFFADLHGNGTPGADAGHDADNADAGQAGDPAHRS